MSNFVFSPQVCMCSEDLCNKADYDLHVERANRLFQVCKLIFCVKH